MTVSGTARTLLYISIRSSIGRLKELDCELGLDIVVEDSGVWQAGSRLPGMEFKVYDIQGRSIYDDLS